jgi:hypothetical protein
VGVLSSVAKPAPAREGSERGSRDEGWRWAGVGKAERGYGLRQSAASAATLCTSLASREQRSVLCSGKEGRNNWIQVSVKSRPKAIHAPAMRRDGLCVDQALDEAHNQRGSLPNTARYMSSLQSQGCCSHSMSQRVVSQHPSQILASYTNNCVIHRRS